MDVCQPILRWRNSDQRFVSNTRWSLFFHYPTNTIEIKVFVPVCLKKLALFTCSRLRPQQQLCSSFCRSLLLHPQCWTEHRLNTTVITPRGVSGITTQSIPYRFQNKMRTLDCVKCKIQTECSDSQILFNPVEEQEAPKKISLKKEKGASSKQTFSSKVRLRFTTLS